MKVNTKEFENNASGLKEARLSIEQRTKLQSERLKNPCVINGKQYKNFDEYCRIRDERTERIKRIDRIRWS